MFSTDGYAFPETFYLGTHFVPSRVSVQFACHVDWPFASM
jgi:hypothetical protein